MGFLVELDEAVLLGDRAFEADYQCQHLRFRVWVIVKRGQLKGEPEFTLEVIKQTVQFLLIGVGSLKESQPTGHFVETSCLRIVKGHLKMQQFVESQVNPDVSVC